MRGLMYVIEWKNCCLKYVTAKKRCSSKYGCIWSTICSSIFYTAFFYFEPQLHKHSECVPLTFSLSVSWVAVLAIKVIISSICLWCCLGCIDESGKKREHGEGWKCECTTCSCDNGGILRFAIRCPVSKNKIKEIFVHLLTQF